MFKQLFLVCAIGAVFPVVAQLNMSLVGHLDYNALHSTKLNDCWGYVDETGIEYALVGTRTGTSVVSLEDPANPQEVFWVSGVESVWRDLQVYGDYAYITTEAEEGLLIIDLSPLPASNALTYTYYYGPAGNNWTRAHDIFIDTAGGWAYICGANRGNGGLIILDIHTDPLQPIEVGEFDNWYCHDAFAQGNLLYGAHISDGFLSVIDVTDHSNPQLINTQVTPNSFTHNVWVTSDDQFAVTTDEIAGAFLTVYDVSNPNALQETDRIRSSPGSNVIPHNAFILGDSLIVSSYYTDGITIHDMRRPHNLVEIAAYDTHPLQNGTFNGCWGAYPFLPSGLQLASDITEGLFILQPNIVPAAYYEGLVRDASDLQPLNDVQITIANNPQTDRTTSDGQFAVGTVTAGVQYVSFYKTAYYPQTIPVNFTNGTLLLDTIDLIPIPGVPLTVIVQDEAGEPIIGADIRITRPEMVQEATTNGFGEHQFQIYYPGNSTLTAGKWGYVTTCSEMNLDAATGTVTVTLSEGIYDDFAFDFGWTTTIVDATSGWWERGIPITAEDTAAPPFDAFYDCDGYAYVTGNANTANSDFDDVDNGMVILRSPIFDLTGYTNPYLYLQTWFFCGYGPGLIDDTLRVYLSNGLAEVEVVTSGPAGYHVNWMEHQLQINTVLQPTANMQLRVVTQDLAPNVNVTEAAIDAFMVSDQPVLGLPENQSVNWTVYPNPATNKLSVSGNGSGAFVILQPDGSQVISGTITESVREIALDHLAAGIYFLQMNQQTVRFVKH